MIGASDEPLEVSPIFFLSGRRSVAGWPGWYINRFTRYALL